MNFYNYSVLPSSQFSVKLNGLPMYVCICMYVILSSCLGAPCPTKRERTGTSYNFNRGWTGCGRPLPSHLLVSLLPSRSSPCFAHTSFPYFPLPFNFPSGSKGLTPLLPPPALHNHPKFTKSWRADVLIPVTTESQVKLRGSRVQILL